jgi:hypothetical protein
VVQNDKAFYVLINPDATADQVFDYTIKDRFGRIASAKVRVKVSPSANPGGRTIPTGPPIWADMVKLSEGAALILWSEGTAGHVLQCQQSVDRNGVPTSGAETCYQINSDGVDMTAAASGDGKYVVAWHEEIAGKLQVVTAIHSYPALGRSFVASTPNTYGSVERLGAPAVGSWHDRIMTLWPEWSSVPTFYARAYSNVVSRDGGHPIGERGTLIKNVNLPQDHRILPRPDGSFVHVISHIRSLTMMAHGANGAALWPARVGLVPSRADVLGYRLNAYQVVQLPTGGFALIWSDGFELVDRQERLWMQRYAASGAIAGPVQRLHGSGWKIDDLAVAVGNDGRMTIGWREAGAQDSVSVLASIEVDFAGAIRSPPRIDYWTASAGTSPQGLRLNLIDGNRRHLLWREGPERQAAQKLRVKILP